MKELLEDLAKLDPACYDEIWRWALWLEDPDYGKYEADDPDYLKHRDDVIQGCVQRACITEGWPTIQSYDCDPDYPEMCDAEICSGAVDGLLGSARSDSPAKSILAAYIAARKAQPCHL